MFATAFYAVLDLNEGTLRYSSAGHPGGIATGPAGVQQLASGKKEKGPGLGLIAKADYPSGEIPLEGVQRLLMFTDGILEAENPDGEPFLEKRLMETAGGCNGETLEQMLDLVLNRVLQYSDSHHFDDDVCLLGVEVLPVAAAAGV
jgi:sigma-B regulation protein RsbU (phosphoserine phosphatase)